MQCRKFNVYFSLNKKNRQLNNKTFGQVDLKLTDFSFQAAYTLSTHVCVQHHHQRLRITNGFPYSLCIHTHKYCVSSLCFPRLPYLSPEAILLFLLRLSLPCLFYFCLFSTVSFTDLYLGREMIIFIVSFGHF